MVWLGSIASFLFILGSSFQMIKSIVDGNSRGVSHLMIWMVTIGFCLMIPYVLWKAGWDFVLLSTYFFQLIEWSVIAKYKYFEREQNV